MSPRPCAECGEQVPPDFLAVFVGEEYVGPARPLDEKRALVFSLRVYLCSRRCLALWADKYERHAASL